MDHRTRLILIVLSASLFEALFGGSATADPGASTPAAPKKIFYADPIKGSTSKGNGTKAKPWGSLESIVQAKLINGSVLTEGKVHANDVIYLMSGNHGSMKLWGPSYQNTGFITLQAAPGHKPVINSMLLSNCFRWVVRGVTFENPPLVTERQPLLIVMNASQIIIDSNRFHSQADVRMWTEEDWEQSSATFGIQFNRVTESTISRNRVTNIENGIAVSGDSLEVANNTIDYFANDGIQFAASNTVISRNRITNHYGGWNNGFHHDGMQGWTAYDEEGTTNVVLDGNTIIASTGAYKEIPAVPTGVGDDYMQGLNIFDGKWSNLTVTNNVVAAAANHGMSFYNQTNAKILNNTVVQQSPAFETWLGVFGDSTNVIVRNNIAYKFALPQTGVVFDSNLSLTATWQPWQSSIPVYKNPAGVFAKWSPKTAEFDFRLAPKSFAIGRGSKLDFAPRDIVYVNRNPEKVDMGAYAFTPK